MVLHSGESSLLRLGAQVLFPPSCLPVLGSISDSDVPRDVLSRLRQAKGGRNPRLTPISQWLFTSLCSHDNAVNALSWSQSHAHLLASGGMDRSVCMWNVWSIDHKLARIIRVHNAVVKDVQWLKQGLSVLSCGYNCSSKLTNVENGIQTWIFEEDQVVAVIKCHPDDSNLFLSGGSKGQIRLWDIRTRKMVHEYIRGLGPILDIEFTINGKHFISSCEVSENSIVVWDVSREIPLSNQLGWGEACVWLLRWYIYLYSYLTSDVIRNMKAYERACIDDVFHPVMANVIASCGWNGEVSVFE